MFWRDKSIFQWESQASLSLINSSAIIHLHGKMFQTIDWFYYFLLINEDLSHLLVKNCSFSLVRGFFL